MILQKSTYLTISITGVTNFQQIVHIRPGNEPTIKKMSSENLLLPYIQLTIITSNTQIRITEMDAEYQSSNWKMYIPPWVENIVEIRNMITQVPKVTANLYRRLDGNSSTIDEMNASICTKALSSPRRNSIKKKRAAQRWGKGIIAMAWGYVMNASPGPDVATSATGIPDWSENCSFICSNWNQETRFTHETRIQELRKRRNLQKY